MEFSRVGEHTIKCVISEEEICDLGFTLDEIMSNGERTQEFMNHIFDLAEQEFQMKFELGIKSVRADFMPDHTLALTFSDHPVGGMMEHLKDLVNGLINSIPPEKWEEMRRANAQKNQEEAKANSCVIVLFEFDKLDTVMSYARQINLDPMPFNALYKQDHRYFLMMDLTDCREEEVKRLSALTDEYAVNICVGPERRAYMEEHAEIILEKEAIETLRRI